MVLTLYAYLRTFTAFLDSRTGFAISMNAKVKRHVVGEGFALGSDGALCLAEPEAEAQVSTRGLRDHFVLTRLLSLA